MPRGRKPKIDTSLPPKETKIKSPWAKETEKISTEVEKIEFSQAVIEKNRELREKSIAIVATDQYIARDLLTSEKLIQELAEQEGAIIYWRGARDGYIQLYAKYSETDEEVISRLRQKKIELEKLKEELGDV